MHSTKWDSKFDDSEQSPGFLLWKTQLIWRRQIEKALSSLELTQPQFVIMASVGYLTINDNAISQIELATHTLMDINTTSQILRALEKRNIIVRSNKPGNEKAKYSKLTELGSQLLANAIQAVETFDDLFFGKLSKLDQNNAKEIFAQLIKENS